MRRTNATLCLFVSLVLAAAAGGQEPGVCESHAEGGALDFWLGRWEVLSPDRKTVYGRNRVVEELAGCAVFEHWTSAGGGDGKSLFFLDARRGGWTQVWVTGNTAATGGLKQKRLIERFADGGVRFQGRYPGDGEDDIVDRTTLTPLPDGTVRQVIDISRDGGRNWTTVFDAIYVRVDDGT